MIRETILAIIIAFAVSCAAVPGYHTVSSQTEIWPAGKR